MGDVFWLLIQEKGSMQVSMFIPAQTWRGGNCKAKRGAQWKTNDPRNHYITFHPWPPTNPNTNGDAKVKEDDVKTEEALLSNGHNRDWANALLGKFQTRPQMIVLTAKASIISILSTDLMYSRLLFLKMLRTTVLVVRNTPLINTPKGFSSEMTLEVA